MALKEFTERLAYVTVGEGQRILVPSELDLAIQRAVVDKLDDKLVQFDEEEFPPEIARSREEAMGEGRLADLAVERVRAWEDERLAQRTAYTNTLRDARRRLDQMEQCATMAKDQAAEKREADEFRFRVFHHGERLEVEEKNRTIDRSEHETQNRVNTAKRDLDLLQLTLLGKRKAGAKEWEGAPGLTAMSDQETRTLIERMWAHADMASELAGFFR